MTSQIEKLSPKDRETLIGNAQARIRNRKFAERVGSLEPLAITIDRIAIDHSFRSRMQATVYVTDAATIRAAEAELADLRELSELLDVQASYWEQEATAAPDDDDCCDEDDLDEEPKAKPKPGTINAGETGAHVRQFELFTAIMQAIVDQGVLLSGSARQIDSIRQAADLIVAEFARPDTKSTPASELPGASYAERLERWLASDDHGQSSLAMAREMQTRVDGKFRVPDKYFNYSGCFEAHPTDNSDLGRCLRLLEAVPEFRKHLSAMGGISEEWKRLVGHWEELEGLYKDAPDSSRLYERMREILDANPKGEPATAAAVLDGE